MKDVAAAIRNVVPINQFNRGLAGKIFEDVKKTGAKVVIKNNQPECVLLSPEEYVDLIDEINDMKLLVMAEERLSHYDPTKTYSMEEVEKKFGVTQEDYDLVGDVEIE